MNLLRIRERASALRLGELNDPEYLQEVVNFIVRNKEILPDNISRSLREAFSKQPSQRSAPSQSRQIALSRLHRIALEDLKVPESFRDAIPNYKENGKLFWTGESSQAVPSTAFQNVLSGLYYSNKRREAIDNVRRAFHCVALYRVIQSIIKLRKSKTFTTKLALFCAEMIFRDCATENTQTPEEIAEELKSDYNIGSIYESYTLKEGNGIIFYLFVLPSTYYEKYLNKSDDVDTVLNHYRSLGFQQEDSAKLAATSIIGFITNQFSSQLSNFRPTKKRGCSDQPRTSSSSKRSRENPHNSSSRATHNLSSDQGAHDSRNHNRLNNNSDRLGTTDLNGMYCVPNPQLPGSTANVSESIGFLGNSASSDYEQVSRAAVFDSLGEEEVTQVREELESTIPNVLLRSNGSVNSSSNAAHLMNAFQLECMIDGMNAAQLMQDFHLENFDSADHPNAAQLMEQFDLFHRYYSVQGL